MTAWRPATWLFLLAISCGGGGGSSKPAESAAEGDDASGESSAGDAEEGTSDAEDAAPAAPRRMSCDDGTCSPCGEGFCLAGWYCDETAKGGPSCGWLRECPEKVSCGCLSRVFSSCSCEEKAGGVHLTCG
ncbi:MAG TPA: hypothetical protein VM686_32950 [Polyangiaceae bacterium]|jgi:hypothetical protein|nr:hypothetical protein [Polyangiaceae bacterium]